MERFWIQDLDIFHGSMKRMMQVHGTRKGIMDVTSMFMKGEVICKMVGKRR